MKTNILIICAIALYLSLIGVLANKPSEINFLAGQVQTTDTLNTFRTEFNSLDALVRSTTSTLGTFANLATTTGNIPIASSSVGWGALVVGANGRLLTASSTAPLGVSWEAGLSLSANNTWTGVNTYNNTSTFNATASFASTTIFTGNIGASTNRIPKGWFSDIDSTIGTIGTLTISSVVSGDLVVNGGNVNLASTTKAYQIGGTTVISSSSVYGVSSTTVKTSSFTMNQYDATTTKPYSYVKTQIPFNITITEISCDEFASASTNTIAIYRATSTANLAIDSVILASLGCGINGTSTTSFTTTTVLAGQFIVASTTVTAGTPSWSAINIKFTK